MDRGAWCATVHVVTKDLDRIATKQQQGPGKERKEEEVTF